MRRTLFAAVAAAICLTLVPAAGASAAPQTLHITDMTVFGGGGTGQNCTYHVTVKYKGKVPSGSVLTYEQVNIFNDFGSGVGVTVAPQRSGKTFDVTIDAGSFLQTGSLYHFIVGLNGADGNTLAGAETSPPWAWTGTCPAEGTSLGSYSSS